MAMIREKQAHLWERDPYDWYVEPYECSAALFQVEQFEGIVWDPACGMGRIVEEARNAGLRAVGSDIVVRSNSCDAQSDFLSPSFVPEFDHIVTNPPFGAAEDFVREALAMLAPLGKLAVIVPLVWLSGFSTKRDWLPRSPLKTVYPISPRPSMPPGRVIEAGVRPGNGTKDFAWLVWQNGYSGEAAVRFLNTNMVKRRTVRTDTRGGASNGQGAKEWAST